MYKWYVRNQDAVTWFIIGIICTLGIIDLITQRYVWALIDFGLAYFNYRLSSFRVQ